MIAAIYARKSTDQSDVSDAEKSVTRQISLAKAFAAEGCRLMLSARSASAARRA